MREEHLVKACVAAVVGIGVGAALMYVFDPDSGKRRRASARDKTVGAANDAIDSVASGARELRSRTQGALAEARSGLSEAKDALTSNRPDTE